MKKIKPAYRYCFDTVSVAALAAMACLLGQSSNNHLNPDALGGFLHTYTLAKLFTLIMLAGLGICWLSARVVYYGNNEYRVVWLLTKLGDGNRLYQSFERTGQPPQMGEWLTKAGYKKESYWYGGWWRWLAVILIILFSMRMLRADFGR